MIGLASCLKQYACKVEWFGNNETCMAKYDFTSLAFHLAIIGLIFLGSMNMPWYDQKVLCWTKLLLQLFNFHVLVKQHDQLHACGNWGQWRTEIDLGEDFHDLVFVWTMAAVQFMLWTLL